MLLNKTVIKALKIIYLVFVFIRRKFISKYRIHVLYPLAYMLIFLYN